MKYSHDEKDSNLIIELRVQRYNKEKKVEEDSDEVFKHKGSKWYTHKDMELERDVEIVEALEKHRKEINQAIHSQRVKEREEAAKKKLEESEAKAKQESEKEE